MKAAVFLGGRACAIEDSTITELGADQVLIALEGCGICASNLPVWEGRPWFQYPLTPGSPGHEPWGRVVELGERVTDFATGDRVTGLSYRAYADTDVAAAAHLVRIPDRYEGRPFPGEALGCAMNVVDRAGIEPGMKVAIVGAGFIGSVAIQIATAAGASVTAYSQRQWSLDRAVEQGAVAARSLGTGIDADSGRFARVIECTGVQPGLDAASKLVAAGGRLIIAGYHQEGLRSVDLQEWNWKGIDVINAHEREPARYVTGMKAALSAIREARLDPWPLFSHSFPLDRMDEAFRLMLDRPDGFTKAVLAL